MEKLRVYIVLPKNKRGITDDCEYWYIPSCPITIDDVDDWYNKISKHIDNNFLSEDTIYIPNSLYDIDTNQDICSTKRIFIVGSVYTQNDNNIYIESVPENMHIAYRIKKNYPYKNDQITEVGYDFIVQSLFYLIALFLLIICTNIIIYQ